MSGQTLMLEKAKSSVEMDRNGQKMIVPVTENDISEMISTKSSLVHSSFSLHCRLILFLQDMPAEKAGLKKG